MHEHVTCKRNCIIGCAQSKPISTQAVQHVEHLTKRMKFLIKYSKPIPKITQNLFDFEKKTPNFAKIPKT